MKDAKDNKTGDLLKSPTARRQAAFKERMRAAGYKQFNQWLTDAEAAAVLAFIEQLRADKKEG